MQQHLPRLPAKQSDRSRVKGRTESTAETGRARYAQNRNKARRIQRRQPSSVVCVIAKMSSAASRGPADLLEDALCIHSIVSALNRTFE